MIDIVASVFRHIGIVIVNYNAKTVTLDCLESLRLLRFPDDYDISVMVLNNGCKPDEVVTDFRDGPRMTFGFRTLPDNLGFSGANNIGISYFQSHGAEYVWLLNNDTIVNSDTLLPLIDTLDSHPHLGAVGSKIYYYDAPSVCWYSSGRIAWWKGSAGHVAENVAVKSGSFYITGCSLIIRGSCLDRVGLLDERYFMYYEDVDLCKRIQENGWELAVVDNSTLLHRVGYGGGGEVSPTSLYYSTRSRILFIRKNASSWLVRTMGMAFTIVSRSIRVLQYLFRGKRHNASALIKGLYDGMLLVSR